MEKRKLIKELKKILKNKKIKQLSEEIGISRFTLWRFINLKNNGSYLTYEKIASYINAKKPH